MIVTSWYPSTTGASSPEDWDIPPKIGILIPVSAKPLCPIERPNIIINTPLYLNILLLSDLLNLDEIYPNPSINGTVPIEKANIDKAPITKLPVPSA